MLDKTRDAARPQETGRTTADRLYDLGFFLVEAFGALEVTAVIVANARITETLGMPEEWSSFIINSYLYPLFVGMLIILLLSRRISGKLPPLPFFLTGLLLFACGNIVCCQSENPSRFFTGRFIMGVGGAISFAGQLWTLSVFHRRRMMGTLVWGEAGTALGVVAGPIVGAVFAQASPEGWRHFFLLNAGLGLATAAFAYFSLRNLLASREEPAPTGDGDSEGRKTARVMTAWQLAVSILMVGTEYLFSDYLQAKLGMSPMFVGGMTLLASAGAIVGSLWAARMENQLEKLPFLSTAGLLLALALIAQCLAAKAFIPVSIPIFGAGLCTGLASVSIYASIVQRSRPDQFLPRSMVYLLGMQIGNALGVQAVGMAELRHLGLAATACMIAVLPLIITVGTLGYSRAASGK
ncbi:MAG: MFS transporter [Syntrophobacteraceae bacterium]